MKVIPYNDSTVKMKRILNSAIVPGPDNPVASKAPHI
jgi:hypothetical protein